ncbi:Protein NETWORKED 1A [Camellia lanceoleosa]|uniref:Protein NETWORKED 1A n=1 Tax=Camellia lanceoleosa TaxID=1840588 RepID=A0ACC0GSS7_9ERIC|nr:Protein NETWORKED 1A [Camellia lanceoleosa]
MAEAFPNQVPFVLFDDSPLGSSAHERGTHTPEMPHRYEHCLEKISKLESEFSCAQEEIRCLNRALLIESAKLKSVEEKCVLLETSNQSLQLKAENLVKKIAMKDQQLFPPKRDFSS